MSTRKQTLFLSAPATTPAVRAIFDEDIEEVGYVMNSSRLWGYQPETHEGLFELMEAVTKAGGLTVRQRAILVTASASTLGDSYCSLAWGSRLAAAAGADTAAGVLLAHDAGLTSPEQVMADWARKVTRDPNGIDEGDVRALREAGFEDQQIFAMTTYVALRIAFSTVNDALGAHPDGAYRRTAPPPVLDAVTFGRPIES